MSRHLSARLNIPHIELDALNWQPGWRDLTRYDPEEFERRVTHAIDAPDWIADGNYVSVRDQIWARATDLVWLDYERRVIMKRVVIRSLGRVMLRTELWSGNRERWSNFVRPSHPIRWAWRSWEQQRSDTELRVQSAKFAHLTVLRLRTPRETKLTIERLADRAAGREISVGYPGNAR